MDGTDVFVLFWNLAGPNLTSPVGTGGVVAFRGVIFSLFWHGRTTPSNTSLHVVVVDFGLRSTGITSNSSLSSSTSSLGMGIIYIVAIILMS